MLCCVVFIACKFGEPTETTKKNFGAPGHSAGSSLGSGHPLQVRHTPLTPKKGELPQHKASAGFSLLSGSPSALVTCFNKKRPLLQHRKFLNHNGQATQSHPMLCISVSIRVSVVF
jgi:hypothetical protein